MGRDDLGSEDDFFQLGGHSLRATRVVAQIRATFQVQLPLAYFFEHPTIVQLAAEIERLGVGAVPRDAAREDQEELSL